MVMDEKFWVGISICAFVLLVAKPLKKMLFRGLDARSARIKSDLDEAARLKEEAQALLVTYKKRQKQAMDEMDAILEQARREAERNAEVAKKKLEEDLNKRSELAVQKIAQMELTLMEEIKSHAVDITVSAARAMIVEHLTQQMAQESANEPISKINRKFH